MNDSNERAMGEFAETSAAKKSYPSFVTVKATVQGQHKEFRFKCEDLMLIEGKLRSITIINAILS